MKFRLIALILTSLSLLTPSFAESLINAKSYPSSIETLKEDEYTLKQFLKQSLSKKGYDLINEPFSIEFKPNSIIIRTNTTKGKKFLKVHIKPFGTNEYLGALLLSSYGVPVIHPETIIDTPYIELLIEPFLPHINEDGGILWDLIWRKDKRLWKVLDTMFSEVLTLVKSTLVYEIQPSCNDKLFEGRLKTKAADGTSGRLESFYQNSTLNLANCSISWDALLDKKWIIDGIEYEESLRELIQQAKAILSPIQHRWTAISHGDWHEMNVYTSKKLSFPHFLFLDCEVSGRNEVIGDSIIYLTYNSIFGDYLSPKYFPKQFDPWTASMDKAQSRFPLKKRNITASITKTHVVLDGVGNFGTSSVRKRIANIFVNKYFTPLQDACKKAPPYFDNQEARIKSCLFMRLLAVYNISEIDSNDQAKIFGLLFKSIGTHEKQSSTSTCLQRFLDSL
jgi:hypothetical protein